jgi:acyl-CoA hydrolase
MDWREEYKRRLTSAGVAVKAVGECDLVVIPIAGPGVLPHALVRHRQRARERIAVAHPDFRAELRREAERVLG